LGLYCTGTISTHVGLFNSASPSFDFNRMGSQSKCFMTTLESTFFFKINSFPSKGKDNVLKVLNHLKLLRNLVYRQPVKYYYKKAKALLFGFEHQNIHNLMIEFGNNINFTISNGTSHPSHKSVISQVLLKFW
jgi:hypothetical protein